MKKTVLIKNIYGMPKNSFEKSNFRYDWGYRIKSGKQPFLYFQAGLIPSACSHVRTFGRFFETTKKLFCRVLNPHKIHTLQNQHTLLISAGYVD